MADHPQDAEATAQATGGQGRYQNRPEKENAFRVPRVLAGLSTDLGRVLPPASAPSSP